tara:strand:- start:3758 stop:4369 length:612 start_codon:yes stop_codon:yes gene_type:complete
LTKKLQQILAFSFGVAFVIVLLVIAVVIPSPTPFQYTVFRVVLALAAAGVAAMIPGFLQVNISGWLRAGGALGVFAVVYFYNPAELFSEVTREPDPTAMFPIVLACNTENQVQINTFSFPYSDIKKKNKYSEFSNLVAQLPNQLCSQNGSKIFRMSDEVTVGPGDNITLTSSGNLGAILIPESVINQLGGNHLAFTKIHSYIK